MTEKLQLLISRLVERTVSGRVRWAQLDDNAYRTTVGGGLVRVTRGEKEIPWTSEEPTYAPYYSITVTNAHAQVVEEEEVTDHDNLKVFESLDALFKHARRSATNSAEAIDEMLNALDDR